MPLYDFRCEQGHVVEAIRPVLTTYNSCPTCGMMAERIYSNPATFAYPEPDTRGMFRRFQEASAERPEGSPPLWNAAKQRAIALSRAGEIPWRKES